MAGFTGGEMAFETGSNSYLQALRRATKEALYMYLHVRVTNRDYADSIGDTTAVRHAFTTSVFGWRHLVALIDIVAVVLFTLRRARRRHRRQAPQGSQDREKELLIHQRNV